MDEQSSAPLLTPSLDLLDRPVGTAFPILRAGKIRVPHLQPASNVERPRLAALLPEPGSANICTVVAPAGYGKSTAIAQQVLRIPSPVAWFTAEARDNHPGRFLEYAAAALQTLNNCGKPPESVSPVKPSRGEISAETIAETIEVIVRSIGKPCMLVIDDFHNLTDPVILNGIRLLVEYQPGDLLLVISTRSVPDFPLARWRVQRKVIELRAEDLRFTVDEARQLLDRDVSAALTSYDMDRLIESTAGWATALRLVALRLGHESATDLRETIRHLPHNNQDVMEFFEVEVLRELPTAHQEFLIQTSILDRLRDDICAAVVNTQVKPGMLGSLAREGYLLLPLDDSGRWFRPHPVFASLLRRRLASTKSPEQIRRLHHRASRVWEDQHEIELAVDHAVLGEDWARASDLATSLISHLATQNQIARLRSWFDAFPRAIIQQSPEFSYWYAWTLLRAGILDRYEDYLANAERIWSQQGNQAMLGATRNVRAKAAFYRNDHESCYRLAEEALASIPEEMIDERQTGRMYQGLSFLHAGRTNDARAILESLDAVGAAPPSIRSVAAVELGLVDNVQGHLNKAKTRLTAIIDSNQHEMVDEVRRAHVWLADIALEQDDDKSAEGHLRMADERANRWGSRPLLADTRRRWVRLLQRRGQDVEALALLDQIWMETIPHGSPHFSSQVRALQVISWRQLDQSALINRWIEGQDSLAIDDFDIAFLDEYSVYAEVMVDRGRWQTALGVANAACDSAKEHARAGQVVKFLGIRAIAQDALSDRSASLATVEQLLRIGETGGYLTTLAHGSDQLHFLIREIAAQGDHLDYVARIEASTRKHRGRRPGALQSVDDTEKTPLSERELEVLRLIAIGLSNREISEQLFVSVPTVKRHLTNLFGKLGATNRTEAVFKARSNGIL